MWATVRPSMFVTNYENWIKNCKNPDNIDTYIAVNTEDQKHIIKTIFPNLDITVIGDNIGVVKPIWELSKNLEGNPKDIILVVCDDVRCILNWDEYIFGLFSNFNGAIMVSDGLQSNVVNATALLPAITMPLMTYDCFLKINRYIFHPDYKHYYADNELYYNLLELGYLKDIRLEDNTTFQHIHYAINLRDEDETDKMVSNECRYTDGAIYQVRMKKDVSKRII